MRGKKIKKKILFEFLVIFSMANEIKWPKWPEKKQQKPSDLYNQKIGKNCIYTYYSRQDSHQFRHQIIILYMPFDSFFLVFRFISFRIFGWWWIKHFPMFLVFLTVDEEREKKTPYKYVVSTFFFVSNR